MALEMEPFCSKLLMFLFGGAQAFNADMIPSRLGHGSKHALQRDPFLLVKDSFGHPCSQQA